MLKNSKQKFHVYIWTFYVRTQSFAKKKRHFCGMCEKDKFRYSKMSFHETFVYSFLHMPQKISFSRDFFCANIKCLDV